MATFATYTGVTTAAPTTAPPAAVATVNGTKTVLQVLAGSVNPLLVWKWSISFDGTGTTPVKVELIHTTTVAATVTAGAILNVGPGGYSLASNATSSTSGTGYSASAEGSVVAPLRYGDLQQILPGNYFQNEFSLGREFIVPAGGILRIRVTDTAVRNCYASVAWDE